MPVAIHQSVPPFWQVGQEGHQAIENREFTPVPIVNPEHLNVLGGLTVAQEDGIRIVVLSEDGNRVEEYHGSTRPVLTGPDSSGRHFIVMNNIFGGLPRKFATYCTYSPESGPQCIFYMIEIPPVLYMSDDEHDAGIVQDVSGRKRVLYARNEGGIIPSEPGIERVYVSIASDRQSEAMEMLNSIFGTDLDDIISSYNRLNELLSRLNIPENNYSLNDLNQLRQLFQNGLHNTDFNKLNELDLYTINQLNTLIQIANSIGLVVDGDSTKLAINFSEGIFFNSHAIFELGRGYFEHVKLITDSSDNNWILLFREGDVPLIMKFDVSESGHVVPNLPHTVPEFDNLELVLPPKSTVFNGRAIAVVATSQGLFRAEPSTSFVGPLVNLLILQPDEQIVNYNLSNMGDQVVTTVIVADADGNKTVRIIGFHPDNHIPIELARFNGGHDFTPDEIVLIGRGESNGLYEVRIADKTRDMVYRWGFNPINRTFIPLATINGSNTPNYSLDAMVRSGVVPMYDENGKLIPLRPIRVVKTSGIHQGQQEQGDPVPRPVFRP